MTQLVHEKLHQVEGILKELDIDCWLTFVRETTDAGDPVLPLILDHPLTWQSALILTQSGERIAIVGKYEDEAVRSSGAWSKVLTYVQSIKEPLCNELNRLQPKEVALNYSLNDVKADGLTFGLFELLKQHLSETPFASRFLSAEKIIGTLRGRKSPGEIQRVRRAIATTEEIFLDLTRYARPGHTEIDIHGHLHDAAARRHVGLAWEAALCPSVTTGPGSMAGHGFPSDQLCVSEGNIFHIDYGVRRDGYCSDLQRSWYVPRTGETRPPESVQKGFDTVRRAILAAAEVLQPGVEGWTVDAAARRVVIEAGYPEYQHATGHQVGRACHDGGGVLGPQWERYGQTPFFPIEEGNIFTLELGVDLEGRGYLGLEEMVLVTKKGIEWLSSPQESLPLLPV
ncbi:MAG: Xaa-Pro peptidase family protein [Candidatus Eisenbacteria bacterium]|uniref:Xaa-Pro peptidase family protein n=1 Tax=Eiseniibacteriota bacterium TaxID=2212470 RepID=A0A948RUX4_UNCEI|nr:Xaa-Pro peptidase family protein [Candidatus Eisenbacteria bacterium]MBU1949771.1 Xaa-Pro peptidase family protein [Candidatus Eisenbacteria bacterium]MBU2689412.1 Xaa-Pro peptidase family protein [Candidatus Eisenbacteria bacterium]